MDRLKGQSKKLSAYVGEADMYDERPLYQALVEQARTAGCAGATAFRGMLGFGATSREHAKHDLRMSVDKPVIVSVIDNPVRITALAEVWQAMLGAGMLVVEDANVIAYRSEDEPQAK